MMPDFVFEFLLVHRSGGTWNEALRCLEIEAFPPNDRWAPDFDRSPTPARIPESLLETVIASAKNTPGSTGTTISNSAASWSGRAITLHPTGWIIDALPHWMLHRRSRNWNIDVDGVVVEPFTWSREVNLQFECDCIEWAVARHPDIAPDSSRIVLDWLSIQRSLPPTDTSYQFGRTDHPIRSIHVDSTGLIGLAFSIGTRVDRRIRPSLCLNVGYCFFAHTDIGIKFDVWHQERFGLYATGQPIPPLR